MRDFMTMIIELHGRITILDEELKYPRDDVNYRDAANKTLDEYEDYMKNPFDDMGEHVAIKDVFCNIISRNIELSVRE